MYVRYFIIGFLSLVSSCISEKEDAGMQPDAVEVGDVLQGQPSFILFFNTACGDCRCELPLVQQMYERYGADGRMVFMAISREQDAVAVGEYWADNGLTIPFSAQTDRTVYHLFAYSSIPRIYVVDASRIVRAVFTDSPLATSEDLTYEIERVLTEIKDTEK